MRDSVHDGVNGHDLHGPAKQENTNISKAKITKYVNNGVLTVVC